MLNKYVVEVETDTGHVAFATTQIAAVSSHNSELTVAMISCPKIIVHYRNAELAYEAYAKIAAALRAVA